MEELTKAAENQPAPTLEQLTFEIKFHLNQIGENILEVGKRLIQAKEMIPHGGWKDWLKENFNLSYATAARFIQCAERFYMEIWSSVRERVDIVSRMLSSKYRPAQLSFRAKRRLK